MSEELTYALRFRRQAQADVNEAIVRLAELVDIEHAASWYMGLQSSLATLATFPRRCPVAKEKQLFRDEVRILPYRHRPGNAIYQIFFVVSETDEDAPSVYILHIRHAARKPMTRTEARKIEDE